MMTASSGPYYASNDTPMSKLVNIPILGNRTSGFNTSITKKQTVLPSSAENYENV